MELLLLNYDKTRLQNITCNCKDKSSCPHDGNCFQSSIIYCCKTVTPNILCNVPRNIGLTKNTFKDLGNYQTLFDIKRKKMEGINIQGNTKLYTPSSKRFNLCLAESYNIVFSKPNLLNKRIELVRKCRHRNKYLSNF